ncbi:hypothetical protein KMW28_28390 [Flammeovirga yaeyamensis]|uniref:Lipocalin-like domain-containing protein n=1 Tax=Flammeovirga yaeyamensis TaxID=367791 RepID=A0AAX1NBE7_9BACT|nr:hypothetical protein [Flammeovirga yaeyamensis]MBB3697263.1 hypothetical protein [Flammeovirga yaeyamensis]NMF33921.1 hypothetical protein [Flammeovirga yaeyamensis]QWG04819.1 hypothetical protein KMW28_28390 [Flammeovirga yaeyamensis]
MQRTICILIFLAFTSCIKKSNIPNIQGTWELISAESVENEESKTMDLSDRRMIKMFSQQHFAFFNHDVHHGKDSSEYYASGGGTYRLAGDQYTENLEYCSYRPWEGHKFTFRLYFEGDTLVQIGKEEIESLGVDRLIIEKYKRIERKVKNIHALPLM